MAKKMLIDATHDEEVRVAIVDGNRLEEFDSETSTKRQIKGNVYLAKVIRIEPSLQAAFVEFGGNRHGFLPFAEIHPDYFRIPVSDRSHGEPADEPQKPTQSTASVETEEVDKKESPRKKGRRRNPKAILTAEVSDDQQDRPESESAQQVITDPSGSSSQAAIIEDTEKNSVTEELDFSPESADPASLVDAIEEVDLVDEEEFPRRNRNYQYKIQEVIKRRQIMLVQVIKEERGNKGAALTTYLSLPGRYCVLMPNAGHRGGGISRKIGDGNDRRRLRDILKELEIPEGMSLIVRTAGQERNKLEIRRDFDYLLRLWEDIREKTLTSTAPALIYAEGDLIKRSIRDVYNRDVDQILVEGDEAYKAAKAFMKALIPSHTKKVQPYKDVVPLFHRHKVEEQIDSMMNPVAKLPSGGSIVINPTEALVAIDVNSGKATRERHIAETALKTNLEAADEVARQMRLRDLAGLVVIDFIDMNDQKHISAVEKRLKEATRNDRARIQIGRISQFGLLELSRQRLRPSLIETNSIPCTHCQGTGLVRSIESMSLLVLRAIENEGIDGISEEISVTVPPHIDLYLLNQKRSTLTAIEARYQMKISIFRDETFITPLFHIESTVVRKTPFKALKLNPLPLPEMEDEIFIPVDEVTEKVAHEVKDGDQREGDFSDRKHRRRQLYPKRRDRSWDRPSHDRPDHPDTKQNLSSDMGGSIEDQIVAEIMESVNGHEDDQRRRPDNRKNQNRENVSARPVSNQTVSSRDETESLMPLEGETKGEEQKDSASHEGNTGREAQRRRHRHRRKGGHRPLQDKEGNSPQQEGTSVKEGGSSNSESKAQESKAQESTRDSKEIKSQAKPEKTSKQEDTPSSAPKRKIGEEKRGVKKASEIMSEVYTPTSISKSVPLGALPEGPESQAKKNSRSRWWKRLLES